MLAVLATQGCFFGLPSSRGRGGSQSYAEALASVQSGSDDHTVGRVEKARARVRQTPGGVDEARLLAQAVAAAFELGAVERKALDGEALLAEASNALEAAATAFPAQTPEVMFSKGGMLLAAGKTDEGILALRASMDAKPSPRACIALIAELDRQGDPKKEIAPLCKKARPNAAGDETRYALLGSCITHTHAKTAEEGLRWTDAADVKFYKEYSSKLELEEEQGRREQAAREEGAREERARRDEEDRRRAATSSQSSRSASPAPPSPWRLTLHNECKQTVKLFLGKKPKWGSGTYTSLGSNTISSYSGQPGDMVWIVDDSQNGISSLSPSGSQRMKILAGCSGFAPD